MNPKKKTKPVESILLYAATGPGPKLCEDLHQISGRLQSMGDRAMQLRDAYASLRNIRTVLSQHGATPSLLAVIDRNGELSHAIKVTVPKLTADNRLEVAKDLIGGIDHTIPDIMDRLKTFALDYRDATSKGVECLRALAADQKAVLCDLRLHISAISYDEVDKVAQTNICGYTRDAFAARITAINTLQKTLSAPYADWNVGVLSKALDRLGYVLNQGAGEDLDPEEQPEEPMGPELTVTPKPDDVDGSDSPIPDAETDPATVSSSVERPISGSMQSLGWSRKTMLDTINSLIAAVDKMSAIDVYQSQVAAATEAIQNTTGVYDESRTVEKAILSGRTYLDFSGSLLMLYGRELNKTVNAMIDMVVHLHASLNEK